MMHERKDVQKFKGGSMTLLGPVLEPGTRAPDFRLVRNDLTEATLANYKGKVKILCAVPSLDTQVCEMETRRFNEEASKLGDAVVVLAISRDLPFAQKRWCGAAGITRVETLSDFRAGDFGRSYGVLIADTPLAGLLARSVFVIDRNDKFVYQQIVPELTQEPDYESVLTAVRKAIQ